MTTQKLADVLRQIIYQAERGTLARCEQLARDALAEIYNAHEAEQEQAGEAVGEIRTITGTPGFPHAPYNAPIWTSGMQPPPGTKLYTRPQQPLSERQIEACMQEAYATVHGRNLEHAFARAIEAAHGIGITKEPKT